MLASAALFCLDVCQRAALDVAQHLCGGGGGGLREAGLNRLGIKRLGGRPQGLSCGCEARRAGGQDASQAHGCEREHCAAHGLASLQLGPLCGTHLWCCVAQGRLGAGGGCCCVAVQKGAEGAQCGGVRVALRQ